MNVSGSQPPNRSASATPLQLSQFPVDKVSPHVDGCDVLLTQQRASYAPPAVAPSQWSMYTATGTGRSVPAESPMHSQGPSHFAGRSDFDRSIHGGSRAEASPSLSRHDSRGSMLAAKGLRQRVFSKHVGSNTGVPNMLLQSDSVASNLESTFRRASDQQTDVPLPSPPPNHGFSPQEFLDKEAALLRTFPRLSRIQVLYGPVPEDKLDTLRDVVHPEDWPRFVLGEILFKDMRFHKNFMLVPRYTGHRLTFDDPSMLTKNVDPSMIPITDQACCALNCDLYKANAKAVQRRMMQAHMGPLTSEKAEAYRYVTLVSDDTFIKGCRGEPPNPAPASPHSSSPRRPSHMSTSVNFKSEERLTITAVRERCNAMLSSIETTYSLVVGVCGFDSVYVKLMREFNQITTHEFYRAPIRTILFDYDKCDSTCPAGCTQHGIAAPAGYCRHCDQPLSVVIQQLHLNVGSFGTAKPFESNALLAKRVCRGSKFCPGSREKHHVACESAPNNSYALKGDRDRSHFSKNMWIHELLIDAMVHYSKHSDIISVYMKAFRDAVLLRHVNLFHQVRFEKERDALQINSSDIDTMTSDLFSRPDGLGRDADDTGFNGGFTDTPATKRKRQQFDTGLKNSRSHTAPSSRR